MSIWRACENTSFTPSTKVTFINIRSYSVLANRKQQSFKNVFILFINANQLLILLYVICIILVVLNHNEF